MKKIVAIIVIMFAILLYLSIDKQDLTGKWLAEAEIAVQHAKFHILSVPHIEINAESESWEMDYIKKEIVLRNVKSFSSNRYKLKIVGEADYDLQLPIPTGYPVFLNINGEEIFLPGGLKDDSEEKIEV